ncbi:helix-turn-helix domain-containing protein [Lichenicoccus roseus]|uniref:Helix-turn-helix domain-containing protein n=1 Tax=Lichenicoccus roseus TaxID=2683649 RepID=A0A5R9J0R5_9PROT|nr:helix-turn-helix domain-containing protein [Lichenicoccus roseus]TLU71224.1 helix-turn-helix domain-containing protein [Lichenicoccus roseus]
MTDKSAPVGVNHINIQHAPASALMEKRKDGAVVHEPTARTPLPNAFAYTVPDSCRMGGFGRTLLYKLAKEGRLRLLKAGGRTLVCGDSLRALIAGRTA